MKRLISYYVVLIMAMSLCVGCGGGTEVKPGPSEDPQAVEDPDGGEPTLREEGP